MDYKRQEAACYRTARNVATFCAGFTTAAAVLAALYKDMTGFVTCVLITAIILIGKAVLLSE